MQPSIGDQPAFPAAGDGGMTYRMWLIGQMAGRVPTPHWGDESRTAARVITFADAIIAWLDAEQRQGGDDGK